MVNDIRLEGNVMVPFKEIYALWDRERMKRVKGFRAWWRYHNMMGKNAKLINFAASVIEELNLPYEKPKRL